MLELRNITIHLKKNGRCIADNFCFTLKNGEKAAIIGEEGNGKSTLLKYIYDPKLTEEYSSCSGDVIARGRASYLPQTMSEKEQALSLAEYFESAEYYMHMDIISKLSLSLDFILSDRRLGTLSGGEKVKIQLAKLLMEEPDILFLDEPIINYRISVIPLFDVGITETLLFTYLHNALKASAYPSTISFISCAVRIFLCYVKKSD